MNVMGTVQPRRNSTKLHLLILKRILKDHRQVILVKVKVAKINPPIGGNVDEVAVERELNRSSIDFG